MSYILYVVVAQLVRPKEKRKKDNLTLSVVIKKKRSKINIIFVFERQESIGSISEEI